MRFRSLQGPAITEIDSAYLRGRRRLIGDLPRAEFLRWEHIYNTIRPHQALGYRTPLQFLQDRAILPLSPSPSHM